MLNLSCNDTSEIVVHLKFMDGRSRMCRTASKNKSVWFLLLMILASPTFAADNQTYPRTNELISLKLLSVEPYQAQFEVEYSYAGTKGSVANITVDIPIESTVTSER